MDLIERFLEGVFGQRAIKVFDRPFFKKVAGWRGSALLAHRNGRKPLRSLKRTAVRVLLAALSDDLHNSLVGRVKSFITLRPQAPTLHEIKKSGFPSGRPDFFDQRIGMPASLQILLVSSSQTLD